MNKNTFRVFSDEVKILLIFLTISVSGYIWVYTSPTVYNRDNVLIFLLLTIMLVVLPIILFIWSFYTKWPKIVLTNIGINKILLGKEQISINWNNIKDIKKIRSTWAIWIFISTSKMESNSMRKLKKR